MIFVTIGSMLPFDRMIECMDRWAAAHPDDELFAQIGEGTYEPKNMKFVRMLPPDEFGTMVSTAEIVVAHAGMGSAIQSAETGTPVVLFPRLAAKREHTTDHQLHTAKWLKNRPGIFVAMDESELDERIAAARSARRSGATLGKTAPADFTARIRQALIS